MKYTLLLIILILSTFEIKSQEIPEMNFNQLEPYLHQNNDTTYIINFWATWCKPCIEELPHFLKTAKELKNNKVKFIFVSLDFPRQKESRLEPYIKKHNINESVILLNDPNGNIWINKVDSSWSGAIPATLIYNYKVRRFFEKQISETELKTIIKSIEL